MKCCCREEKNDPFVMPLVEGRKKKSIGLQDRLALQQESIRLKVKKIFPLLRMYWDSLPGELQFPSAGV